MPKVLAPCRPGPEAAQGAIKSALLYCFLEASSLHKYSRPPDADAGDLQGVGEIYSLEDDTCTDDMNRGVLKVILHEVCAAKE